MPTTLNKHGETLGEEVTKQLDHNNIDTCEKFSEVHFISIAAELI